MRTGKITILGAEHPLCFSTRVVCAVTERFGSLEGLSEAMHGSDTAKNLEPITWVLAQMLDAGRRHAALIGSETPERAYTQDDLMDLFGVDDLLELLRAVMGTIAADTAREVDVEPPKNAAATGGA